MLAGEGYRLSVATFVLRGEVTTMAQEDTSTGFNGQRHAAERADADAGTPMTIHRCRSGIWRRTRSSMAGVAATTRSWRPGTLAKGRTEPQTAACSPTIRPEISTIVAHR